MRAVAPEQKNKNRIIRRPLRSKAFASGIKAFLKRSSPPGLGRGSVKIALLGDPQGKTCHPALGGEFPETIFGVLGPGNPKRRQAGRTPNAARCVRAVGFAKRLECAELAPALLLAARGSWVKANNSSNLQALNRMAVGRGVSPSRRPVHPNGSTGRLALPAAIGAGWGEGDR